MRAAPALPALLPLLLLLLLPLLRPALAQDAAGEVQPVDPPKSTATSAAPGQEVTTTAAPAAASTAAVTAAAPSAGAQTDKGALGAEPEGAAERDPDPAAAVAPTTVQGSSAPAPAPSDSASVGAPAGDAGATTASTQPSPAAEPELPTDKAPAAASSSPAVPDAAPQGPDPAVQAASSPVPTKPAPTGAQDGAPGATTDSAPEAGKPATSPPAGASHPASTASAPPASPSPAAATDSGAPGSTPRDGDQRTVTPSGLSPAAGSTSVPAGSPSTASTVPPGVIPGHEPDASQKPEVTETPALSTGSTSPDTVQPTDSSASPIAESSTVVAADSSAPVTSSAPHEIHPSPTATPGSSRDFFEIHCEPPERFSEKMLVLNFTKTGLCAGSPPDDKLATLLCQAAKATFNPAHDQCHIWLAPVPEIQALAVKEITIQTNLLPQDVYESLRDKWDALKEVGVSNMQLGEQGPPEEAEDRFSMPLIITIICMASFLLLVAALYGCCHQRLAQRKDQQRLTEELQTVENGYHDNPTLEVMETSSEMQEKKVVGLNGELGDSWIVPLDNLTKDDLDEEEDTHL
ncbi:podocalyxin isoform X1 [Sorex araneus]|uniref:podocalyxin isoform X1 n=1 Tax=Sorex araneus TaxID=42254 RepID=UPI002433503E|nr:podocalyxin isoform X1 [Sorex araneus]